jgi:8-oxo-dGTP diphosphatase
MEAVKPSGCSVVFIDPGLRILLLLRDDIPAIPYPGMWDLPGGHVEPGETPRECLVREIREEMGLDVRPVRLFRVLELDDRTEHVFWKQASFCEKEIHLTEGQRLAWFPRQEIRFLPLAYGFNAVVELFFESRVWETGDLVV